MKSVLLFILLLISSFSFADAWDNLTKEQADAVVAELKMNPYIFDYCDCCSTEGEYAATSHLLKVISAEIVECSWNADYYSIVLDADVICEVVHSKAEGNEAFLRKPGETLVSDFSMNYTWGFNTVSNMASPFFNIVPYDLYDELRSCRSEFTYPTPKQVKAVSKDKGYAKWFKKNMR